MRDEIKSLLNTEKLNNHQTHKPTEFAETNVHLSCLPHPLSLKILLWDIDGTLMHSTRTGAYKEYFIPTLEKVYGTAGNLSEMQVSGMTDTQIAHQALKDEGFTVADIVAKVDEFIEILGEEMAGVIAKTDNPYGVFNGVREILSATDKDSVFVNSLLTGNMSVAAEIKLRFVDLWHYFEGKPHAFGEISHRRSDLAKFAGIQFNKLFQTELHPEQFIIIGDTPNDIACARAFGAKAVAVATGKNHSAQELSKFKPDVLLQDLSRTSDILNIFKSI